MEVIEVSILDSKVKRILNDLADLELIKLSKPYKLSVHKRKEYLQEEVKLRMENLKETRR